MSGLLNPEALEWASGCPGYKPDPQPKAFLSANMPVFRAATRSDSLQEGCALGSTGAVMRHGSGLPNLVWDNVS